MEKYGSLSKLYLKYQMKRTILTICGVAFAACVLFVVLNLYFSNFINQRDALRKEADYEIVFFPETDEQAANIVNDDNIKSAYAGDYFSDDGYSSYLITNAVFVDTKNPYQINAIYEKLTAKYGVEGRINNALASYYLQGDRGDLTYIVFIMFLFLTVIIAIIAVGIIRNSIQLNTLEQVKDYGILRCIGATRGQLKSIIFLMGFWQELAGLILGLVLGLPISMLIGAFLHIKVRLHIVPVLFVLVAFLGDLYFVMSENSKIVKKITPVEAVRGNLTTTAKKLKARKRSIFGLLFGTYGDYAYKSLMSNKGRFYKSVAAFGLGTAAFIILSVFSHSVKELYAHSMEAFGDYQIYFYNPQSEETDIETLKSELPSYDLLEKIAGDSCVKDVKQIYNSNMYVVDNDAYIAKYNEDFLNNTVDGTWIKKRTSEMGADSLSFFARLDVYGYGEDELKDYEKLLIEGTLDVSENGIVIARKMRSQPETDDDEEIETAEDLYGKMYVSNDYELGDKIDIIVNMKRMQEIYDEEFEKGYSDVRVFDFDVQNELYKKCKKRMMEEGWYKTYVVEGIVEYEKDKLNYSGISVILPLKNYCDMTGFDEEESSGIKYKVDDKMTEDFMNLVDMAQSQYWGSQYVDIYRLVNSMKNVNRYILMFIVFVVVMSSVNIINTSASTLHLRRKELAQLRVLGVSKKGMYRMVLLEGIITALTANLVGDVLGFCSLKPVSMAFLTVFQVNFAYPIGAAVIGFIISTIIFCGSLYVQIRRMGNSVLEGLNAGGD
ncbi:MAG: ABC transporter permease [Clostridium sp.]|nr:ABC transporter permease [Clostridium sp.]